MFTYSIVSLEKRDNYEVHTRLSLQNEGYYGVTIYKNITFEISFFIEIGNELFGLYTTAVSGKAAEINLSYQEEGYSNHIIELILHFLHDYGTTFR